MATLILLLLFALASVSGEENIRKYTEVELYNSELWTNSTVRLLVLSETNQFPNEYISALQTQLANTTAYVLTVTLCSDGSDLCTLLSAHPAVVRANGTLRGVRLDRMTSLVEWVTEALSSLLHPSPTHITTYSDYLKYCEDHTSHLLTLSKSDQHYIALLTTMLSLPELPLRLVVTMAMETLPLTHRPLRTQRSLPIHLWFVSGHKWYKYEGTVGGKEGMFQNGVKPFLERTLQPLVVVEYEGDDSDIRQALELIPVNVAYTFYPGNEGEQWVAMVTALALKHFQSFIFVTADRSKHFTLENQFYFTIPAHLPYMVIVPHDKANNVHLISPEHVPFDLDHLTNILDSVLDHSTSESGGGGVDELVRRLDELGEGQMLVCFCLIGQSSCHECHDKLQDLSSTLEELSESVELQVDMMVVETHSLEELLMYKVPFLPSLSLYTPTISKWTHLPLLRTVTMETATAGEDGTPILQIFAEVTTTSTSFHSSEATSHADQHKPLQEDDHFGLLSRTIPEVEDIPSHLLLTDETFSLHVANYRKTAVVFYLKWCVKSMVFLHHFMAAVDDLDPALNASLCLVNCGDYPKLCSQQNVTSYPTAIVYTGSLTSGTKYTGVLDSRRLLQLLGDIESEHTIRELTELTPKTLPSLLRGDLSIPLVLWFNENNTPPEGFVAMATREEYSSHCFAWLNSSQYSRMLNRVVEDLHSPAVLVVELKKHAVFKLQMSTDWTREQLQNEIDSFLRKYSEGGLQPAGLFQHKDWLPLQPPIHFPSPATNMHTDSDGQHTEL